MYEAPPSWLRDDPYLSGYDDRPDRWFYDDGCRRFQPGDDRLVHLVQVDGRLVDCWTEPVERSAYARYARQFDLERQPPAPPVPPTPPHIVALTWLDAVLGGRAAVHALRDEQHPTPEPPALEELPLGSRHRLEGVLARLNRAEEVFDSEVRDLLIALLGSLWELDPRLVLGPGSADRVAAGMLWVIGRANDLFNPATGMTQTRAKQVMELGVAPSAYGPVLARELRGLDESLLARPQSQPDLLMTGRPELLTVRTRRRLIRLRDQALAAQASTESSGEEGTGTVLP